MPERSQRSAIAGQRFGRLVVIEYIAKSYWRCRCDCGNLTDARYCDLRRGLKRSCGCLKIEVEAVIHRTHGLSYSSEYHIWATMIARCTNPRAVGYENYGGRGIFVCERWRGEHGFTNFYADMGPRPSLKHSLERKDNDGPYSPENCMWATRQEQNANSRHCRYITVEGLTKTIAEWSRLKGTCEATIRRRLNEGWSSADAVNYPAVSGGHVVRRERIEKAWNELKAELEKEPKP